ncbi:MAG: metalloregulator ArsR/SmtB family transcription factor [Chloroflexota bacterium]|nr:helix-turn-helix transcriptional regulator [Chloroflexota bacterium]
MKKELTLIKNTVADLGACCKSTIQPALNQTQAEQAANLFAALADPTRLTILNLLAKSQGEVCVCDITASFKLGQPTISHHLKILRDVGLITGDRRGKWVYYSLVRSQVASAKNLIQEVVGTLISG